MNLVHKEKQEKQFWIQNILDIDTESSSNPELLGQVGCVVVGFEH